MLFEEFVRGSASGLLGTAWLVTGHRQEAEDVVQSVLARLAGRWSKIQDDPLPYARKAVVNEALSRRRRKRLPEIADWDGDLPSPTRLDDAVANSDQAERWLAVLPPRQRAVIVLRFWCDLTEAATAAELGVALGTVKSQTAKALATLRPLAMSEVHDV